MVRIVYIGFLISLAAHFFFPLMAVILVNQGLDTVSTGLLISFGLLCSALIAPYAGELLDKNKHGRVLFWSSIGILSGLCTYQLKDNLPIPFLALGISAFICGTATLYTSARRITEGIVKRDKLQSATASTYLVENAGIGIAALIAFFLLDAYADFLVAIDAVFSISYAILLYFVSNKLNNEPQPSTNTHKNYTSPLLAVKSVLFDFKIAIPSILILISGFASFTGLQMFYNENSDIGIKFVTLMKVTNTVIALLVSLYLRQKPFKIDKQSQLIVAALLIGFGIGMIPYNLTYFGVFIATLFWSAGEAIAYPAIASAIISKFPEQQSGLAVSVKDLVIKSALIASPLVAITIDFKSSSSFQISYLAPLILSIGLLILSKRLDRKCSTENAINGYMVQ